MWLNITAFDSGLWNNTKLFQDFHEKHNPSVWRRVLNGAQKVSKVKWATLWIATAILMNSTIPAYGEDDKKSVFDNGVYYTQEFVLEQGVDWDLYIDYAKKELYEANEDENGNIHPEDQDFIDRIVIQMEDEGFYDRISPWLEEVYRYTGMKLRWIDMIHMAELVMFLDEGNYIEAKNIIDFYSNLEWRPGFSVAFNKLGLIPVEV